MVAMSVYEVVASAEQGGAPVRENKSLTSKPLGKLGVGAVVTEVEKAGERMKFTKVSGSGPPAGWVSVKLLAKVAAQRDAKTTYKGTGMFAVAESKVESEGAEQALRSALADKKTAAVAITIALAHLCLGKVDAALDAADEAVGLGAGSADAEGSALLVQAACRLAYGEFKEAAVRAADAVKKFKESGDRQMEASALTTCANARLLSREGPAAAAQAKEALAIFRDLGDSEGEAAALNTLTDAYAASHGTAKAQRNVNNDILAHYQAKGDKKGQADTKRAMASALLGGDDDDMKEALQIAKEAVDILKSEKQNAGGALQIMATALLNGAGEGPAEAVKIAEEAVEAFGAVGDKSGQAKAMVTVANAASAAGDNGKADKVARDAQVAFKALGDRAGEASALLSMAASNLADDDTETAAIVIEDALNAYREAGDKAGEASALQTAASIYMTEGGDDGQRTALRHCNDAMAIFRHVGNTRGEGITLHMLSTMQLSMDGGGMEALMSAERARSLFLLSDDKKYQGLASHAAAQGHMLIGDYDFGLQSAMQAVVLSRDAGDKQGEAQALHTATNGMIAKGRYGEALRLSRQVQNLFHDLGSKEMEESAQIMVAKIEAAMPARAPGPRTYIQPMDDARLSGQRSLFQENPNCVIWCPPINQHCYVMYLLELLKLVDDLKNQSSKTQILCASQGSYARQTGEMNPVPMEGTIGMTIFAVARTVRLESPRLHIATVDIPSGATAYEITECLRSAMVDAGNRGEVSYALDRKGKVAKSMGGR